jgi:hypothetical protein
MGQSNAVLLGMVFPAPARGYSQPQPAVIPRPSPRLGYGNRTARLLRFVVLKSSMLAQELQVLPLSVVKVTLVTFTRLWRRSGRCCRCWCR